MVNKYPARCHYCGGAVVANGGTMWKYRTRYYVAHLECTQSRRAAVDTFVIGGKEFTRNSKGRCEDAPCCGCCTI